jgi:hypothetical protein
MEHTLELLLKNLMKKNSIRLTLFDVPDHTVTERLDVNGRHLD